MILLDTGYLVALLNPQDELHGRAVAWGACVTERMLVSEYVVWEVINYYSRPVHRQRVHALVDHILSDPSYEFVPASASLFELGRAFHRRHGDKAWSLTDCISFVIMGQRSITRALSHDAHFEQAGLEAMLRTDPPQAP